MLNTEMPNPAPHVLAIDQGTQSTRAIVFDELGAPVAETRRNISLNRIDHLQVEQDGQEILDSCRQVIDQVIGEVGRRNIACAGLATQRSSIVAWHAQDLTPLSPVLSWQDRRAEGYVSQLSGSAEKIKRLSGLKLTPHYGASKMRWLLENNRAVAQAMQTDSLRIGPLTSFLLNHLLAGRPYVIDQANAARTQLCNVETGDWDPWLRERFELDTSTLPAVHPIRHDYGVLGGSDVPLTAVHGDQNAAIHAFGPVAEDTVLINLGTGAFILANTGTELLSHPDLLSARCDSDAQSAQFTIEGTVNGAGAGLNWAAKTLQRQPLAGAELGVYLNTEPDCIFINTVGGLGSPYWRDGPAPHWIDRHGHSVHPNAAEALAAVAESMVFLLRVNFDALKDAGVPIHRLRISGGLAQADALCQRLANLCTVPVVRPTAVEATARGIAWLAVNKPARWETPQHVRTFLPASDPALQARHQMFVKFIS